ncbi:hypothetical protein CJ030_MR3G009422 [Morella rubra]|uniref:rRNA-processing protein EBP2 n=1 Tax=Morella rubra TaxID=262757 RepID=A0A6A1WAA6_9ROSI|nr:hypothetical protein CJ030_MR3G009422 [Morella rubra]
MGIFDKERVVYDEDMMEDGNIEDRSEEASQSESESEEDGDARLLNLQRTQYTTEKASLINLEILAGLKMWDGYTSSLLISIKSKRPSDYYAEMVKTDSHMVKVKGRLLAEKKKIEEAEERRKAREAKRLSKEIQAQKLKERTKQKKDEIESVKKWRKQRQQSGFAGGERDVEMDLDFEDGKVFEKSDKKRPGVAPGDRSGGKAKRGPINKKKQQKIEQRSSKFGSGGKKALKKQNSAETTNDLRGFNRADFTGNKKRKR